MIFGRPQPTPHPRRPHRYDLNDGDGWFCACGKRLDEAKVKMGRSARNRGNSFEREVARKLGVRRVGQYGGPDDVAGDWISVQCKVGNRTYLTRTDALLRRMPYRADRLRAVVHGDAPGSSGKRRSLITLDFDEFCAWYGGVVREE